MQTSQPKILIKDIPLAFLRLYFTPNKSLFRHYQELFLELCAPQLTGEVIELGCEKSYDNRRFFLNSTSYRCTNIGRDYDEYLDMTQMPEITDNSVNAYVCVSVLEHVKDFHDALHEIHRTLKPGGMLLMTVPFMYPIHDEVDYWRFSSTFFRDVLSDYKIITYAHLGGTLSTVATLLQRPKGNLRLRYLIYKVIGFFSLLMAKYADQLDSSPLGFGILVMKQTGAESKS